MKISLTISSTFLMLILLLVSLGCKDSSTNGGDFPPELDRDPALNGLWVAPTCSSKQDTSDISVSTGSFRTTTYDCLGSCSNGNELLFEVEWSWTQVDENTIHMVSQRGKNCGVENNDPETPEVDVDYSVSANSDTLIIGRNLRVFTKVKN